MVSHASPVAKAQCPRGSGPLVTAQGPRTPRHVGGTPAAVDPSCPVGALAGRCVTSTPSRRGGGGAHALAGAAKCGVVAESEAKPTED